MTILSERRFAKAILARTYNFCLRLLIELRSRTWPKGGATVKSVTANIVLSGYIEETLGIGRAGRLSLAALKTSHRMVTADNLRSRERHLLFGKPTIKPDLRDATWIIHANAPEAEIALDRISSHDWSTSYRIAYWVWETSIAPASWVRAARYFDEIWVPSMFVYQAFVSTFKQEHQEVLVERLRIVPHPVRETMSVNANKLRFGLSADKMSTLCLADGRSGFERKNPQGAVTAWLSAFADPHPQAELLIKCHHIDEHDPSLKRLRHLIGDRPDIRIMNEDLDSVTFSQLLASTDLILSLHRAEGFGLVLAEALLLGVSVIATGYSGNMAFMQNLPEACVSYTLVPATGAYRQAGGVWAEPDYTDAAQKLRHLADDPAYRRALAIKCRVVGQAISSAFLAQFMAALSQREPRRVKEHS